jgi:hypothetical protein
MFRTAKDHEDLLKSERSITPLRVKCVLTEKKGFESRKGEGSYGRGRGKHGFDGGVLGWG